MNEGELDRIQNPVDIFQQIAIPDTNYLPILTLEESRPPGIMCLLVRIAMRIPIKFNNELRLFACEVSKIGTNRMLPPELQTTEVSVPQF